jgi:LysM repeat protein
MWLKVISLILLFCSGVWSGVTTAQQNYPGAAYFSYQCQTDSITFYYQNSPIIHTSFAQITQALASAASTQRNRLIAATREISLWALKSNELQIHLNHDSEGTKLVFPANICGLQSAGTVSSPTVVSSQAAVFAQSDVNGQASAIAVISPTGEIVVYAQTSGGGTAFAFAQTTITNNNTGSIYVVQQGDTLYSIARRNNTTVALLVQLNNLADPNRISVGQRIQLP